VKGAPEAEEINELNEVKKKSGAVAAFFDLDGTLVALPSMEKRLFGFCDTGEKSRKKLLSVVKGSAAADTARDRRDSARKQNVSTRCANS